MANPAPSVFVVLSLGAFSGGIVKGITGFGNAIINLLVWVAFTAAGVNGGPLRLAVLADSIGCVVCSVPLLLLTSAHKTADWRLVATIVLFGSAGAPLGAALLTHLNPRWVELAMACALLLVICAHIRLHHTLPAAWRRWRDGRRAAGYGDRPPEAARGSEDAEDGSPVAGSARDGMLLPLIALTGPALDRATADSLQPAPPPGQPHPLLSPAILPGGTTKAGSAANGPDGQASSERGRSCSAAGGAGSSETLHRVHMPETATNATAGSFSDLGEGFKPGASVDGEPLGRVSATLEVAMACCQTSDLSTDPGSAAAAEGQLRRDDDDDDDAVLAATRGGGELSADVPLCSIGVADTQPLLGSSAVPSDAVSEPGRHCHGCHGDGGDAKCTGAHGGGCGSRDSGGCGAHRRGIFAGLQQWLARQDWLEIRRIVVVGSGAGFASGVMGGMTGIAGPPIMFMYEKLEVVKEVVRGTNAVINVLQVRLVSYLIMGVFHQQDMPLYAVTSLFGLAGVFVGSALAGSLDQKGFSRVLVALMTICCALLFVSAAGLKGHTA